MNISTPELPPLLVTSSVRPCAPYTELQDEDLRLQYTLDALNKWLVLSPKLKLVICDGSNFDFTDAISERFPDAEIECLHFQNNQQLVSKYGKGYGEGEIVRYALKTSKILGNSNSFMKCTAKYWVNNFSHCLKFWNGIFQCNPNLIFNLIPPRISFETIDTIFYIANKEFYLNNLISAHINVRDYEGHWLEHCFRDVIIEMKNLDPTFGVLPEVTGFSGSSGKFSREENSLRRSLRYQVKRRIAPHVISRSTDQSKLIGAH